MKKGIFILGSIIAIAILFYPQQSISLSTGSPGGKTGSPIDGVDCMQCHGVLSTSTTTSNITSNIPPSGYVPGNIYNITAVHNGAGFGDPTGFEITCEENTSNTKTGIFFITNSNTTQLVNNGSAVTHTTAGNSFMTWSFDWEAPLSGTGNVTFYGAFIEAGYPIGLNQGDYFSSTTLSASEFIPLIPQTYIPDDNFEQALINLGYDTVLDDSVTTANIDTVTTLNINNHGIADLTGVEDFNALIYLDCHYNQITTLDVSGAADLTTLYCNDNQITSLDVSTNIALTTLRCDSNQLINLDVSNNTDLTLLWCFNNQITSLDISNNAALTDLECSSNHLLSLDVSNGGNTNFTNFWASYNTNLTCIKVDGWAVAWSTANWTVANYNIDAQHYFSDNCSATSIQEHTINKELLKVLDLLGKETNAKNQPLFYIYDDGTVEKRIIIE